MNTHSLDLELSLSQYAYCADNADLSITEDISIELWIKLEQLPSTIGSFVILVGKYDDGVAKISYLFYLESDNKGRFIYSADGTKTIRNIFITDAPIVVASDVGKWVHLAVTVDVSAKSATFYKNSSPVADTLDVDGGCTAIHDNDIEFGIGARPRQGVWGGIFDGLMDDVRLWDDIRTEQEINDNRYVELVGNEANLVGYWKLNNNYTDSAKSSDLTAVNNPVFSTDVPYVGAVPRSQGHIF